MLHNSFLKWHQSPEHVKYIRFIIKEEILDSFLTIKAVVYFTSSKFFRNILN